MNQLKTIICDVFNVIEVINSKFVFELQWMIYADNSKISYTEFGILKKEYD
jgi:hypothetical protein